MKKLLFLLVFFVFLSCGDKKAEPFGKTTDATDVAVDPTLKLGEEIFNGVGLCKTCHLPDKKVIGLVLLIWQLFIKRKTET
jgi:cytochrome c